MMGFIGAIFGFLASFFKNTNFNLNFRFRGIPLSFGFQGHFRNIYVGVAGFTVQVTGQNSIFQSVRGKSNEKHQTLFDEAVGAVEGHSSKSCIFL